MIEVYKYIHNAYNVSTNPLPMDTGSPLLSTMRGHEFKLKRFCRNVTRANFFSFRAVESWNQLPPSVVTAPTLNCFKVRLERVWAKHLYNIDIQYLLSPQKLKKKLHVTIAKTT